MQQKTDTQLVALARAGQKRAFGQLIDRHGAKARRLAYDLIGDKDSAQEMAQEAFVQAYLSLEHLRDGARFGSWLGGIVFNVCRGHLREQQTARRTAQGLTVLAAPDPQVVAEERERRRLVAEAIESLSPENRAATRLFYFEQHSLNEIAALLGISVTAVKGRLHKSRQQLKARLLPLYPHLEHVLPRKPRRNQMVKVSVAGVYLFQQEDRPAQYFLKLADDTGRQMTIWIGQPEAWAISFALEKAPTERPMTMDLLVNFLREAGAALEEIHIAALQNETFYAVLKMRFADGVREMDARPSDALALALRTGSPIFVAPDVMERGQNETRREQTALLLAPMLGEETEAVGVLADAILRQALAHAAAEVRFDLGATGVGILFRVRNTETWENTPALPPLPRTILRPLGERFLAMATAGREQEGEMGYISLEHGGQVYRAYVFCAPSEGESVHIRLDNMSPHFLGAGDYSDEEAVRRLASAIMGQGLREGATQIIIGLGQFVSAHIEPDTPGASRIYFEAGPEATEVHVLFRVADEWQDAMTLPKAALKPLAGRFMLMSTYGQKELWHIPIEFQNAMYDAHVTVTPGQHGEGVHIALKPMPPE